MAGLWLEADSDSVCLGGVVNLWSDKASVSNMVDEVSTWGLRLGCLIGGDFFSLFSLSESCNTHICIPG